MLSDVVDRLTGQARRALQAARRAALDNHDDHVGTEHLLWSLLAEAETGAAALLETCGIDVAALRGRAQALLGPTEEMHEPVHLPATPAVKRVLEAAAALADQFRHPGVGTEHLLVGLAAEENGMAGELLGQFGATLPRLSDRLALVTVHDDRDLAVQTVERSGAAPLRADPTVEDVRRLLDVSVAAGPGGEVAVTTGAVGDIGADDNEPSVRWRRATASAVSLSTADDLALLKAFGCLPQLALGLLLGTLVGALWGTWVMVLCMAAGLIIGASRSGWLGSLGGAFAGYHLARRLCGDEIEALFVILAAIFAGSCIGDWPRRMLPPGRAAAKRESAAGDGD
jgi:hypothetical protein